VLLSGRYVGERYITAANTKSISSFVVYDVISQVDLTSAISVSAGVRNLTDREYVEVDEFPIPGREYELKFSYRFL